MHGNEGTYGNGISITAKEEDDDPDSKTPDAHFYNKTATVEDTLIQRIGKWLAERDGRHIPKSSWQLNPYHDIYLEEAEEFLVKFGFIK